jgi:integrase
MNTHTVDGWAGELRAQDYSEKSIASMTSAPRLVAEHADVEPDQITRGDVLAYLGRRRYARNTRLKYLSWLALWCRWAGIPDATAGIRRPPVPRGLPKPVGEPGLASMIAACGTDRERCWVYLGAFAGLRAHESAKVEVEDLEVTAGGAWHLRVLGKGRQIAVVPIPDWLAELVLDAADAAGVFSGRIWPTATSNTVQFTVTRVAARAGVACTSHQLRHRYGTDMYERTKDLLMTQKAMRHASPVQTAGYAQVAGDRLADVVAAIPRPGAAAGRPGLRVIRGGA